MVRRGYLSLSCALALGWFSSTAQAQGYAWINTATQCAATSYYSGACIKVVDPHANAGGYVYFPNAGGFTSQSASFNSLIHYQNPYPSNQRGHSELVGNVGAGPGSISVSAQSQGYGSDGFIGSSFSGAAAFVDTIKVDHDTLPVGTPIKVTVSYSLGHASAFSANVAAGIPVKVTGTSKAVVSVTVPGGSNPSRSDMLVPTDIIQANGPIPEFVNDTMVFDSFVGATVSYQLMVEFATILQTSGGLDRYGNTFQFTRAGWDSAGVRITASTLNASLGVEEAATAGSQAVSLDFPSDAGFHLVAASGFDYSLPFEVLAIPEPSTAALMSLGGLLLVTRRRRSLAATRSPS